MAQRTGIGIYPQGAMLNHSCNPNTMQCFDGKRILFRAVMNIPAGTEAAIAYVELAATRPERRHMLKTNYCFDIDQGQVCIFLGEEDVFSPTLSVPASFNMRHVSMAGFTRTQQAVYSEGPFGPQDDSQGIHK
jgi:hypothetical protein